ncbi:hypothetical protein Q5P01_006418 [Channa striata]|uniref:Uncharacterized protein n=1 Tax=Channa striata TaxID=64152 RepID=A0AA88SWZ4_CHASR|nr:hypothetical protein Q5P01_006418 [Channa striata]
MAISRKYHQSLHVGVMSVVCAWISSQWKLWTALCPALRGSHLSADAWSPRQSEGSVASPICSTTEISVEFRNTPRDSQRRTH